jgi:hypothetical protein
MEDECVHVDQFANPIRNAVCNAAGHAAAIGMRAKYHVRQFLPANQVDDIVYMSVQVHLRSQQVRTLPDARQSGCEYLLPLGLKRLSDPAPTPAAVPGTVHKNKRRHYDSNFALASESATIHAAPIRARFNAFSVQFV